jgi:hypothetical protein
MNRYGRFYKRLFWHTGIHDAKDGVHTYVPLHQQSQVKRVAKIIKKKDECKYFLDAKAI